MPIGYQEDYYSWTQEQAAFLRQGRLDCLDLENLAEEVASLGRSERRELVSRLAVLIVHCVKLDIQVYRSPSQEKSWRNSVAIQRRAVKRHLKENPGLKNPTQFQEMMTSAWDDGLVIAIRETGLDVASFPTDNPYTIDQLLGDPPGDI